MGDFLNILDHPHLRSPANYLSGNVQFGEATQTASDFEYRKVNNRLKMYIHYGEAHAHSPFAGHPAGVLRLLSCFRSLSRRHSVRAYRMG